VIGVEIFDSGDVGPSTVCIRVDTTPPFTTKNRGCRRSRLEDDGESYHDECWCELRSPRGSVRRWISDRDLPQWRSKAHLSDVLAFTRTTSDATSLFTAIVASDMLLCTVGPSSSIMLETRWMTLHNHALGGLRRTKNMVTCVDVRLCMYGTGGSACLMRYLHYLSSPLRTISDAPPSRPRCPRLRMLI